MSNLARWEPWFADLVEPVAFAGENEATYQLAADWLDGLAAEDWGCGLGWFRHLHRGPYLGVDGSRSKWCDVVADLTDYQSSTPGLLMRHVLEHNHQWRAVLDNAVASFTERMCLVLFTPLAEHTHVIAENVGGIGVPDISFALADLVGRWAGCAWTVEQVATDTAYSVETVIRVAK